MPVRTATYGVGLEELPVLSCIDLPIMFIGTSLEGEARFTTLMVKWLVVDLHLAYNAIIGRSMQTFVHLRTDIKSLTLQFETKEGDATIYVDQREARSVMKVAQKDGDSGCSKEQDSEADPEALETEEVVLAGDRTISYFK